MATRPKTIRAFNKSSGRYMSATKVDRIKTKRVDKKVYKYVRTDWGIARHDAKRKRWELDVICIRTVEDYIKFETISEFQKSLFVSSSDAFEIYALAEQGELYCAIQDLDRVLSMKGILMEFESERVRAKKLGKRYKTKPLLEYKRERAVSEVSAYRLMLKVFKKNKIRLIIEGEYYYFLIQKVVFPKSGIVEIIDYKDFIEEFWCWIKYENNHFLYGSGEDITGEVHVSQVAELPSLLQHKYSSVLKNGLLIN